MGGEPLLPDGSVDERELNLLTVRKDNLLAY
jgi:hypothetical protein